jgi:SAM-dependent methyltransferase
MLAGTSRLNAFALHKGRLVLCLADAGQLPLPAVCFDKVYCLNAFFFFPDPQAAIAEMARTLRPGGALAIVTTPPEMAVRVRRFSPQMAEAMRFHSAQALADICAGMGLSCRSPVAIGGGGAYLFVADRPAEGVVAQ